MDPDPQVIDEMVTFVLLLPLASTSLRARVSSEISCSDASLWGGGAAVAETARRPTVAAVEEDDPDVCPRYGGEVMGTAWVVLPLLRFLRALVLLRLVHGAAQDRALLQTELPVPYLR